MHFMLLETRCTASSPSCISDPVFVKHLCTYKEHRDVGKGGREGGREEVGRQSVLIKGARFPQLTHPAQDY